MNKSKLIAYGAIVVLVLGMGGTAVYAALVPDGTGPTPLPIVVPTSQKQAASAPSAISVVVSEQAAPTTGQAVIQQSSHPQLVVAPVVSSGTTLPARASGVPFAIFTLTAQGGDVDITDITVRLAGPASDRVFDSLNLEVEGATLGEDRLFGSNHSITFKEPFTVHAGETMTVRILGNITDDLTNHAGEAPAIEISQIDASVPVIGALPLRGPLYTVNDTIDIGSATLDTGEYDLGADNQYTIGDTVRFSSAKITAGGQEDVRLTSLTWEQNGSIGNDDIDNVHAVVDGTSYPVDVDGHDYTVDLGDGVLIRKGDSAEAYLEAHLLPSAANRTVQFSLDGDDVLLHGEQYGFDFSADGSLDGYVTTVTGGTAIGIYKAN